MVSIGFQTETMPATVGVMAPASTNLPNKKETLTVVSGVLTVKLPDQDGWQTYKPGENFEVSPNRAFQLQVAVDLPTCEPTSKTTGQQRRAISARVQLYISDQQQFL